MATSVRLLECRFCLGKVQPKHCVGLFTPLSIRNQLPKILSSIFDLPVSPSTQHSPYICQTCRHKANSLHNKLHALRSMGKNSYQSKISPSSMGKQGQKRPKDTSQGGLGVVSPDTLKSQPPKKQPGLGKRLDLRGELRWCQLGQRKVKYSNTL